MHAYYNTVFIFSLVRFSGVNYPLSENVRVSTDTGTVQGFYVYLYDRPGLRPEEWPVTKPLDLQRPYLNVTVFLGIPYAQQPVNEGRFKVTYLFDIEF